MNIFELIEPINLSNQVKTDNLAKQKRALSVSITRRRPAFSFMSSRMSTKSYNDNFVKMPVIPQTRKNSNGPINKSLASRTRFEIMVPDLNKLTNETDRYKFVISASRDVLDKIEPGMYFGIRVGPVYKPVEQQLIYDFDSNIIYRRENVNADENIVVYDPRNVYMMLDKNNYKNIFVDTKTYVPILHSQLISADDLYEEGEEYEEPEDLVPYVPDQHPEEDNIREQAAKEHQRKQFNQHVQDLQDIYDAVENERLPADEDEAMDDELPPPRKGRRYKPAQPAPPVQPAQPVPPAQPAQPAQSVQQNPMAYYHTHIAPRMQDDQEEQDEQDDFIPYDDEKQYMIKLLNIKQTQRREVIEERIIKNFERFFDYLVRKREKSGKQTTREDEIGILFDTYRNKWKNFAFDSLKQFASFLSKYKRDPKVASIGLETLKLMNIENFDLNLQGFLKNFI